jgi:hypothetical protein
MRLEILEVGGFGFVMLRVYQVLVYAKVVGTLSSDSRDASTTLV